MKLELQKKLKPRAFLTNNNNYNYNNSNSSN